MATHLEKTLDTMIDEGLPLTAIERRIRFRAVCKVFRRERGHAGRTAAALGIHRNSFTNILVDAGVTAAGLREMYALPSPHPGGRKRVRA